MVQVENAYKLLHEQFMSGHNGSSTLDIGQTVSSAPVGVLLRNVAAAIVLQSWSTSVVPKLILDYATLVVPLLLCFMVQAEHIIVIPVTIFVLSVALVLAVQTSNSATKGNMSWSTLSNMAITGKRPFISNFRAFVNIASAICILAVDFTVFPRRFCKTETYGTGLMDAGVGSFIIANGLVSREARGTFQSSQSLSSKLRSIVRSIKSCLPLLVLGMGRFVSVKAFNYQEHVSEYGVHWNFFLTLAVVKLVSTMVLCIFPPSLSWLICVAVASGYQYLLSNKNVTQFIMYGSDGQGTREGLFNANREGIISCLGYLAIYFAGVQLGSYVFQARVRLREWVSACVVLVMFDLALWMLLDYTQSHLEPVSRRMANLPFIIWMLAYNVQLLASYLAVDICCIVLQESGYINKLAKKDARRGVEICLLEATNRNGLSYFLLANLLTGAINMSMATLHATPMQGLVVISTYMFVLSALFMTLHVHNVTMKWW